MKITETALEFMLECAKGAHPREFIGLLRAEKGVITETLLFPGSKFNRSSSSLLFDMVPPDPSIVGSVHSHPSEPIPSKADLEFFRRTGRIHLIIGYPYTASTVAAYDAFGKPTTLELVKG